MIIDILNKKGIDSVKVKCDNCPNEFERLLKNILQSRKKRKSEFDYCRTCSSVLSISKKPQCNSLYWKKEDVKSKHSTSIKNSDKYKEAIKNRDQFGSKNGMFNRKHKKTSIELMIKKRTGKKQSTFTIEKRKNTIKERYAYKRNILNVNKAIRGYLNSTVNWYKRIYERDGFKCTNCTSKKKLDAHHKKPLNDIIKELTYNRVFSNENEKYNYLITCPEILDINLENGTTLCRKCHRDVHNNWGSHNIKIK
jgi:hypothetical protein